MKKDVIIQIHSSQEFDGCDPDKISLLTEGVFYKKKDKYYIIYEESPLSGLGQSKTTLKIEQDIITLIRSGENPTHLIFQEGEHHIGLYNTIAGAYTLGVKTRKLANAIDDAGGFIELEYDVELNYQTTGHNKFKLEIKNGGNL